MSILDLQEQRDMLLAELEKADHVIRVMHEGYLQHYLPAFQLQGFHDDLTNRGLGDHYTTRAELLQQLLYPKKEG